MRALPVGGSTRGAPVGPRTGRGPEETLSWLGVAPQPQNHRWPPCQEPWWVPALPALPTTLWAQRHPGIRLQRPQDSAPLVWALLLASVQPCWSQDSWDLLGHTQTVMLRLAG